MRSPATAVIETLMIGFTILAFSTGSSATAATEQRSAPSGPPSVHHILLEVSNMDKSIAFYRDTMGLRLTSQGARFSMLEAANLGVYLSTSPWSWKAPRGKDERLGLGMYPHFEVSNVQETVARLKKGGYKIVQEPREYNWGTEAFVADPDGYTWALISLPKKN